MIEKWLGRCVFELEYGDLVFNCCLEMKIMKATLGYFGVKND